MAFFTANFLNNRRKELLLSVEKFQYQINNSSWYTGEINDKQIEGNAVAVYVNAPALGAANTITRVRVYDNNGALAGEQQISLTRQDINSALLRFEFPLIES